MPFQDAPVVQLDRWRSELAPHEPGGIIKTVTVVLICAAERGDESDAKRASCSTGPLQVVGRRSSTVKRSPMSTPSSSVGLQTSVSMFPSLKAFSRFARSVWSICAVCSLAINRRGTSAV